MGGAAGDISGGPMRTQGESQRNNLRRNTRAFNLCHTAVISRPSMGEPPCSTNAYILGTGGKKARFYPLLRGGL